MYERNRTPVYFSGCVATASFGIASGSATTLIGRLRRLYVEFPRFVTYAAALFSALGLTTIMLDTWGPAIFGRLLTPDAATLPYEVLLLFNLGDLGGVLSSICLVERLGRRGCLALGFFGQATFLLLLVSARRALSLPLSPASLYGVLVPIGMLAASFRVFHWDAAQLWTLEAFPTELRATALAVGKITMQMAAAVALSSPLARSAFAGDAVGPATLLAGFCAVLAVSGSIATACLPLETRGEPMV